MIKLPTISEIRRDFQDHGLYSKFLNDHFMAFFSPYCTRQFIRWGIVPNQATMLMLLFGVIGAVLFSLPNIYIKVLGIVFIYSWYLMDVVDGEIARITQNFSKYGKEFDYTAHVVDHPAFALSFAYCAYEVSHLLSILIIALGFIDSIFRSLQSFAIIRNLKEESPCTSGTSYNKLPNSYFVKYIFLNLSTYPLYALVFPPLFLISWRLSLYYVLCVFASSTIVMLIGLKKWLKMIY